MSIKIERCVPPVLQAGKWWRYEIVTRSGRNRATGFRTAASESEVKTAVTKLLARMEHNERPYGKSWVGTVLRPKKYQPTGEM